MKEIRFGIIGHGFMGHEHEKMLTNMDGIRVVGIADIDPKQLEDVKEGLKRYPSNEALFADPEVDVVLIAANNKYHHDLVIQAARAGKDIICEKPVAMNVAELDEMVKVTEECGVKFTVHHQRRLDPDFRTAKAVFDSGTLGDVYTVQSMLYALGVSIGAQITHLGLFETSGALLCRWEIPTGTGKTRQMLLPDIWDSIAQKLGEQHLSTLEVEGISLGVPCPVSVDGTVKGCKRLGWGTFNVERRMSILTGLRVRAWNNLEETDHDIQSSLEKLLNQP